MTIDKLQKNIREYGWQFQYVFDADGEKEPFSYSIGFEETYDHPEIMLFGLDRETMHTILADLASEIKSGAKYIENKKTKDILSGDFEVLFKPVREECLPEYVGTALQYYEKSIRVLVMFWPDKSNILPTEPGCMLAVQNEAIEIV